MVLGYQGNLQLWWVRLEAITELRRTRSDTSPPLITDDAFHDGRDVLDVVKEWHKLLRASARGTDTITSKVLDLVDQRLFVSRPEDRAHCDELCERFEAILSQARLEPVQQVSTGLLDSLLSFNDNAPEKATEATDRELKKLATTIDNFRAKQVDSIRNRLVKPDRRSSNSQAASMLLMKVGNRSALGPDDPRPVSYPKSPANGYLAAPVTALMAESSSSVKFPSLSPANISQPNGPQLPGSAPLNGTSSAASDPADQTRSSFEPGKKSRTLTHVEEREIMSGKSNKLSLRPLKSILGFKSPDKDLKGYFKHRDIVSSLLVH